MLTKSVRKIILSGVVPLWMAAGLAAQQPAPFPFFALCMDTHDAQKRTVAEQARLLRELGYDGMGHLWLENVAERLHTADAAGLKVFQIYLNVLLDSPGQPYDPRLKEVVPLLNGRHIQLAILFKGARPSDESLDPAALRILREIAELTRSTDIQIVLYPHARFWLERVEDGIRLARKVQPVNVRVMFNLCHWLAVDDEKNLVPLLRIAKPYLAAITINGADTAAEIQAKTGKWIQPLDAGSFDLCGFLKAVKESGFTGPIGLQCYGIPGDAREHLTRSIAVWRKLSAALNSR
jgi:sugar phosphate isomerase/epimerase